MPVIEIIAGAVLGFAVQILRAAIVRAKDRSATTRGILYRLDDTLFRITPFITKVDELSVKSDHGTRKVIEDLKHLFDKAVVLVNAYAGLKRRNLLDRYRYKGRLKEIESSLRWMVDVDIQMNQWADMKELMAKMSEMNTKLDEITRQPINYHENTHKIAEGIDPSLEAKSGCSSSTSKPKIDIHLQWNRKHNKEGEFRFVLK